MVGAWSPREREASIDACAMAVASGKAHDTRAPEQTPGESPAWITSRLFYTDFNELHRYLREV